jgi:hypothetical protein
MQNGSGLFELVFFDGTRSIVVADHLSGAEFDRQDNLVRITLMFQDERNGNAVHAHRVPHRPAPRPVIERLPRRARVHSRR